MQERNIGNSGLRVSTVGLGCNNFGRLLELEATRSIVHKALDVGITLFDCADVYGRRGGAETLLGEVLGPRRKDVVLVTKFGKKMDDEGRLMGGSRRYIVSAAEASLKRLKTDWIDLYQMHDPDPRTPIEESLRALDDLVRQGKVRHIGCSHYAAWQIVEAQWVSRAGGLSRFIACEDEYSLLQRRAETSLFPAMKAHGMGLLPYYPLASGLLTGKYSRNRPPPEGSRMARAERDYAGKFFTPGNWSRVEALTNFAREHGKSLLDLALSWLAANRLVGSVIAGATRPDQVEANVKAVSWALTPQDLGDIDRLCAEPAGA
jgi:aryl-alcohol dehydrogenase-like predicted oxidoreductase